MGEFKRTAGQRAVRRPHLYAVAELAHRSVQQQHCRSALALALALALAPALTLTPALALALATLLPVRLLLPRGRRMLLYSVPRTEVE